MRISVPATILFLAMSAVPVCASGLDDKAPDQQSIDALAARASQAQPRDQAFLYAELMHQLTEMSVERYAAGDVDVASDLLKRIQQTAHQIHLSMSNDEKRLKNAEILLRHTAFRLTGMLHASSGEDRELVAATLATVSKTETEAMLQVFKK